MYGTVTQSDAYNSARPGRSAWSDLDEGEKKAALTVASSALDAMFEHRFIGSRTAGLGQEAAWPRKGRDVLRVSLGETVVPYIVEWATYELAFLQLSDPDLFTSFYEPGATIKRETVGPITTEYAVPQEGGQTLRIPFIEGLLSPVLRDETLGGRPTFLVV